MATRFEPAEIRDWQINERGSGLLFEMAVSFDAAVQPKRFW
jgi:hypothetical protein